MLSVVEKANIEEFKEADVEAPSRYFPEFCANIFPRFAMGRGSGIARGRGNLPISPLFQDVP